MTSSAEERFRASVTALGIENWTPAGQFDANSGAWILSEDVIPRFPESGVECFEAVDQKSFWFRHRNRVIHDFVVRYQATAKNFLEVGAGSGAVAAFLSQNLARPVATVEPLFAGAASIAGRGVNPSFCGDLSSLQLPAGSIEGLGAFDVVEHLENPAAFLRECRRVLGPEGRLFLTVPAYRWLWSYHDEWNGHVDRYTVTRLERLLRASGFTAIASSYFFSALIAPAWIRRFSRRHGQDPDESRVEEMLAPSGHLINRLLETYTDSEMWLLRRFRSLPFGTSIVMVGAPE